MYKLKPCPFCGSKAELNIINQSDYQVGCSNIFCAILPQTWILDTIEEAVESWNKRYNDEQ